MCDTAVFTSYNITPEHWADFIKSADLTEELIGRIDPTADRTPPYVLLHSRSQPHFNRTGPIAEPVKTDFASATYADMYQFLQTKLDDGRLLSSFFLVLDERSVDDRKVVLIHKSLRFLHVSVEEQERLGEDELGQILWRKHRIPFEKACGFVCLLMVKPGDEGDEFLVNTARDMADEE